MRMPLSILLPLLLAQGIHALATAACPVARIVPATAVCRPARSSPAKAVTTTDSPLDLSRQPLNFDFVPRLGWFSIARLTPAHSLTLTAHLIA